MNEGARSGIALPTGPVLILGGTSEARELAGVLVEEDMRVITSLAGRVRDPALPVGEVRIGGFGGPERLAAYVASHSVAAVVDATHPFAAQISAHAAQAAITTGVPLLRLQRPGWRDHPDAPAWTWVADSATAQVAADSAERPLLTTGRQSLAGFLPWADRAVTARVVDSPEFTVPPRWRLIRSRGPYDYAREHRLMREHEVDCLITKDSGGSLTSAKLDAARELGVPVVILERPAGPAGVRTVASVTEARAWLLGLGLSGQRVHPGPVQRGIPAARLVQQIRR